MENTPKIFWDWGTAYDLFCSLRVLHEPGHYGLRPAWAAGVRSRVPAEHREILDKVQAFIFNPWKWISNLPTPKDGAAVVWFLGVLPPEERLFRLMAGTGAPQDVMDILRTVSASGSWTPGVQEELRTAYLPEKKPPRPKVLASMLDIFSRAADSGERYLAAIKEYQRVFFSEEEIHIQPFLEEAVEDGKVLARQLTFDALIENLSHGVRLGIGTTYEEWVFIPSYWISPLVSLDRLSDECAIFMFGGRPQNVSLVPGEVIPDGMLRVIKTLGDPTRLKILRYLSQENITQAEISRRLRLRPPTVTHHLNILRLAGLVYLTLGDKNERRYATRLDEIDEMYENLKAFLILKSEGNGRNGKKDS